MPVGLRTLAVLGVLLAFVVALGTLLGCGGPRGGEVVSNASNATAQPVEEASGTEPPSNVAETAAASIDEFSICTSLAPSNGCFPRPA
jgi:hypothetical protein